MDREIKIKIMETSHLRGSRRFASSPTDFFAFYKRFAFSRSIRMSFIRGRRETLPKKHVPR